MTGSPPIAKIFCALAVALSSAGGYLVYNQDRSSRPVAVGSSSSSLPQAQSHTSFLPSPSTAPFPLILPPTTAAVPPELRGALMAQCLEAAELGLPSGAEVRCCSGYISSLNLERRIPNWVLESVRHERRGGGGGGAPGADTSDTDDEGGGVGVRSRSGFYADPTVPEPFRVSPSDYDGARGLSRGHLAAAQFHKDSQIEMDGTFNMNANIVPQDMTCNAVDWLRLESVVRKLSREVTAPRTPRGGGATPPPPPKPGRLFVVTGPAFIPRHIRVERSGANGRVAEVQLPAAPPQPTAANRKVVQYAVTGKGDVAVPTHLFKVILAETPRARQGPAYEVAAFLIPNGPITEERPLAHYQVNPRALEALTGLSFFPVAAAAAGKGGGGIGAVPDLCRSHTCETRGLGMFEKYRLVARLRASPTVPALQQVYSGLEAAAAAAGKKPLEEVVVREYRRRLDELAAEAVGPMEE